MALMANSVEIPQDIIDSVIAEVGDDTHLLKQCSLVSSSFLLPCRKQLFTRITLSSGENCEEIHQFLVQNPVILSIVKAITIITMGGWAYNHEKMKKEHTSLSAILRLPFCRLECFSICDSRCSNRWNWNNFSNELKDGLSNIIHSSNLKSLSLDNITKVPITFFLHIVHLTTLELHSLSLNDFVDENSRPLTLAVSKGVASHTLPVIDRLVWDLRQEHHSRYYVQETETIFLTFMCHLRFFKITIHIDSATFPALIGSLCLSLTSPATLEHLEINIFCEPDEYDFESGSHETLRNANVWPLLNSITSHPIGSRLQRVDISINYSFRADRYEDEPPDEDKILEAVFDSLPLLCTKGILFVEAFVDIPDSRY